MLQGAAGLELLGCQWIWEPADRIEPQRGHVETGLASACAPCPHLHSSAETGLSHEMASPTGRASARSVSGVGLWGEQ